MFDKIIIATFLILSVICIIDSFKKWRTTRKVLYIVAIVFFGFAAMGSFVDWGSSIFSLIAGLFIRLIAANRGNKEETAKPTSEDEGSNMI